MKQDEHIVAILDPGAQYGKLIDKAVRGLGVHAEIISPDADTDSLEKYSSFIIAGGGASVHDDDAPAYNSYIVESGKPTLGICYGQQLIAKHLGGSVEKLDTREDGETDIEVNTDSAFFEGTPKVQNVLMTHGDSVTRVPDGFQVDATSEGLIAAFSSADKKMYGTQFHPETDLTEHGKKLLSNFLFNISGLSANYTIADRKTEAIKEIQDKVSSKDVLVFVSGGVDSTVTALLVAEALAGTENKIHAIHVDHGMMRSNESQSVKEALSTAGIELDVVEASDFFLNSSTKVVGEDGKEYETKKLSQTTDPEEKRAIIGDAFIHLRQTELERLKLDPDNTMLAMGTLRPDLIESASELASGNAKKIKTHHNDTDMVRELRDRGLVIEPLKELHKDEVRELGTQLGASDELVWRHPFPGPGLGIRLLCAEEPYMDENFERTTEELSQFRDDEFNITLLPVRTVGVQGDDRTLSYLAAISGPDDWTKLRQLAKQVPKKVHAVNRIVYLFGDKLEADSLREITPTLPSQETFDQLRRADAAVELVLRKHNLHKLVAQVPVVSFPVNFGQKGRRSIGIRTLRTNDFMTGDIAVPNEHIPKDAILEMITEILKDESIARVAYDLTAKPPATTEWE